MQLVYVISIWLLFVYCRKTLILEASKFKGADDAAEDTDILSYQDQMNNTKAVKSPYNFRIRQPFPDFALRNRFEDETGDQANTPKGEEVVIPLKSEFIESYSLTNRPATNMEVFMGQHPTMDYNNTEFLEGPCSAGDGANVTEYENHFEPFDEDLSNATTTAIDEPTPIMISIPESLGIQNNTTKQGDDLQDGISYQCKPMKPPNDSPTSKPPNHNLKPGQMEYINRSNPYQLNATEYPFITNINQMVPAPIPPIQCTPIIPHSNLNNFKFFQNRTKTTKPNYQNRTTKKELEHEMFGGNSRSRSNGTIKIDKMSQPSKSDSTKNVSHELVQNVFTLDPHDHDLTAMNNDVLKGGQDGYATLLLAPRITTKGQGMNVSAYDRSNYLIHVNSLDPSKQQTTLVYMFHSELIDKENSSLTGNHNDRKYKIKTNVYNGSHNLPINNQGSKAHSKDLKNSSTITTTFNVTALPNGKEEPSNKKILEEFGRQKGPPNDTRWLGGSSSSKPDVPSVISDQLVENNSSFTKPDVNSSRFQNVCLQKEDIPGKVLDKLGKISRQAFMTSSKILNSTLKKFLDESLKDTSLISLRPIADAMPFQNVTRMPPLECRASLGSLPNGTSATSPVESAVPKFKFWKTTRSPSTGRGASPKLAQTSVEACSKVVDNSTSADQSVGETWGLNDSCDATDSPKEDNSSLVSKCSSDNMSRVLATTCLTAAASMDRAETTDCATTTDSKGPATNECTEATKCYPPDAETEVQTPMPIRVVSFLTTLVTNRGEITECSSIKCPSEDGNVETKNLRKHDENLSETMTGRTVNAVIKKPPHLKVVKVIGKDQYISRVINALKAGPVSELLVNLDVDDSVNVNGTLKCKYLNKGK